MRDIFGKKPEPVDDSACAFAGCEVDKNICSGCGYCPDHHFLDIVGRIRKMTALWGERMGGDDKVIEYVFELERETLNPPSFEMFAVVLYESGIKDLDTIERFLVRLHKELVGIEL